MSRASFREALPADIPALLALQAVYYAEDGYPFAESAARSAWTALVSDASLGRVWVAQAEAGIVGYVVLTFGFSLEYQGRDAFLDEFYVASTWRGQGLGKQALRLVETACAEAGVNALHLEVEKSRQEARALYRRWGFADHQRLLMTKPIPRASRFVS